MRKGYAQVATRVLGARIVEEEKQKEFIEQTSGANRPTTGDTIISSRQAVVIHKEVRNTMKKVSPGIHLSKAQPASPNMGSGQIESGKPSSSVIDLSGSSHTSAPLAIAGSDVSVASTSSNIGQEGNAFSRMSLGARVLCSTPRCLR